MRGFALGEGVLTVPYDMVISYFLAAKASTGAVSTTVGIGIAKNGVTVAQGIQAPGHNTGPMLVRCGGNLDAAKGDVISVRLFADANDAVFDGSPLVLIAEKTGDGAIAYLESYVHRGFYVITGDNNAPILIPSPDADEADYGSVLTYAPAGIDSLLNGIISWRAPVIPDNPMKRAVVALSTSDILDLYTTEKQIAPAPGAGKLWNVVAASMVVTGGQAAMNQPKLILCLGDRDNNCTLAWTNAVNWIDVNMFQFLMGTYSGLIGGLYVTALPAVVNVSAAVNQPLNLAIPFGDGAILPTGSLTGFTLDNAGSGYAVDDTVTLQMQGNPGDLPAVFTVLAVDGGGAITDWMITDGGAGYAATSGYAQASTSGAGIDLAVVVTSITPLTDMHAEITVFYHEQNIPA